MYQGWTWLLTLLVATHSQVRHSVTCVLDSRSLGEFPLYKMASANMEMAQRLASVGSGRLKELLLILNINMRLGKKKRLHLGYVRERLGSNRPPFAVVDRSDAVYLSDRRQTCRSGQFESMSRDCASA